MNSVTKNLWLLTGLCFSLVVSRIIKTEQFSFVFMFWNLFLAFVPYWISGYLFKHKKVNLAKLLVLGAVWILFLPNAPYMITDLFHLHTRPDLPIWYDLLLILSFAIIGMYLFYLSIHQMKEVVKVKLPTLYRPVFLVLLFVAVSYGVYIGRFLRLNSWDVIHPVSLTKTCLSAFIQLPRLKDMACFTLIFTVFLSFLYLLFKPKATYE